MRKVANKTLTVWLLMLVKQVYAPHCRRLGNAFDLLDKTSESNLLNL